MKAAMDTCKKEEEPLTSPNEEGLFGSEFCFQPWLYHLFLCCLGRLFDLSETQFSHL